MSKPLAAFISLRFCHDSKHGNLSEERAFREYPHPMVETLEEWSAGKRPLVRD